MTKRILVYIFIVFLVSCCTPSYRDVSGSAEYVHLIGREFRSLDQLMIYGVSYDKRYETIAEFVIAEKPGFGGPEVLTRDVLPIHSLIQVNQIMACTNCLYSGMRIVVEVKSDDTYDGEIVSLEDRGNILVPRSDGTAARMNPRLFELAKD